MRISDWSSDVCSSDLRACVRSTILAFSQQPREHLNFRCKNFRLVQVLIRTAGLVAWSCLFVAPHCNSWRSPVLISVPPVQLCLCACESLRWSSADRCSLLLLLLVRKSVV